jgi:hypothetical protein
MEFTLSAFPVPAGKEAKMPTEIPTSPFAAVPWIVLPWILFPLASGENI